jgi:tellurite methyltransferase
MSSSFDDERQRWNRKYREAPGAWLIPDPFLERAFSQYILPLFPHGGRALDLAGGAGRHAIWLAKQGWEVTLIDISETGVEQARQNAGPLASHIHFVVDDLTRFQASQTEFKTRSETKFETEFEVVMAFFYLERKILAEIVNAVKPGGLLVYKTHTLAQAKLAGGPKSPAHLLEPGELIQLASGLRVLHYREEVAKKATAELVARKETTKEI